MQVVRSTDRLIILGDFNARVGQSQTSWPDCIGYHGVGNINENGQRLLEFCSQNLLCVTNTYFKGKLMRKVSWKHPRSGHWHQLDVILTRKKNLCDVLHTRSFHSADCDTDHSLVVTTASFYPKKIHSSRPTGRRKLKVPTSKSKDLVESYSNLVRQETASWDPNISASQEWTKVKLLLTETAEKAFGHKTSSKADWFQESIEHLQPFLDSKRQAALNHRLNPTSGTREELTKAKSDLQRNTRYCANTYWQEVCKSIQAGASTGNFAAVYSGIKKTLGPLPVKTALLKEADGSSISDPSRQLHRWIEHYTDLYSQPIGIESQAIHLIPELTVWTELDDTPTIEDLHTAINQLKRGKSPGNDGILAEVIKVRCVAPILYNLFVKCWMEEHIPQDMRDANIITLYKGKGDRGNCNSYRGISLLSIAGKLLGRIILSKLQKLANRIYPESQCGFRAHRSTTDMIFTFRQLQEKCREQKTPLLAAFVDLNKAFDTVSREGLYDVLQRIGCPPKLLNLIKSFHNNMKGSVVYNGNTSDPFEMCRGVRQGCVLAPTLFGIFFSALIRVAFGDSPQGIHLHTRADGRLFNISLLKSARHRQDLFVDSLLFADDAAFVATSPEELQVMVNKFNEACTLFSMSINAKKTVIMVQGVTQKPTILLCDSPLEVVDDFCYLGSTVSSKFSLNEEINIRIGKASTMFGKLSARVWNNKHLTIKTKMIVYQTCILSILLYGAETWTSYAKQEQKLNNFHMRCLRRILDISWKDRVTNEKVLNISQLPSITAILKQRRLRWLGHVQRMEPSRLPRQTLLGQIADAKRPIGRPMLRFKDSVKRDMKSFNINLNDWEEISDDRDVWRKKLNDGVEIHDKAWFVHLSQKRDLRHQRAALPLTSPGTQFVCYLCGRCCRSRIGLTSHLRKCQSSHTDAA